MSLRPIVIDGANVGMAHGNDQQFSVAGIQIVVNYFKKRGHKSVVAFLPQHYQRISKARPVLNELKKAGNVKFSPSASYDDRMLLKYAVKEGAIVVSRDKFRDIYQENEKFRETIEKRRLQPTFIGDRLIFSDDPLGRHGPSLDDFLKF